MKRAIVIKEYVSQSPEQLSISKGDRLYLLVDAGISDKWYFVTTSISPSSPTARDRASGFVLRDHVSVHDDENSDEFRNLDENHQIVSSHRKNSSSLVDSRSSGGPSPPRFDKRTIRQCLARSRRDYPNVVATVVVNQPAAREWQLPVSTGDVVRIVEDRRDHILALAKSGSNRRLGVVPLSVVRLWNTTDGTPILKLNAGDRWNGGSGRSGDVDGRDDGEPSYVRIIGYKRNRQSLIDYKISVTTVGNQSYLVRRSYADFVTLHADIIGSVTDLSEAKTLPVLPPSLSPKEERETAQRRGKALDMYIATVMALPMTPARKSFVQKFLKPDDHRRPSTKPAESSSSDVPMSVSKPTSSPSHPQRQRQSDSQDDALDQTQRISVDSGVGSSYRSRKTSTASDFTDDGRPVPPPKEPPVPERRSEETAETELSPNPQLPAYTDRFSVNMSALIDSYSYSN